MATQHGYGQLAGTESLVFTYDTIDTTNSYKGEPTENFANTDTVRTLVKHDASSVMTFADAPEKGPGWKKVTITERSANNFRYAQFPYISNPGGTQRTYSVEYDAGPLTGYGWRLDGTGGYNITTFTGTGRYQMTITPGATGVYALFLTNGSSATGINDTIYYRFYQVENNPHATQFTEGTRSSTQGLLDLTGNKTISLSTVSFDSNSQMIFDGTDDTLNIGIPLTDLPALSNFTIDCVVKIDAYPAAAPPNGYGSTTKAGVLVGAAYYSGTALYWYGNSSGTACTIYAYIRGADGYRTAGGFNLTPGSYHHLVLVNDYSGGSIKLYANGVLNGSAATATQEYNPDLVPTAGNIGISKAQVDGGGTQVYSPLPCLVPITKIYRKALSPNDVLQNFKKYQTRFGIA